MDHFPLGIEEIKRFLPHRDPFLMIDRILEIQCAGRIGDDSPENPKNGTKVVAIKNVSAGEPFFRGHFPAQAIMPGVLQLEAMAQTSAFAIYPYFYGPEMEEKARSFRSYLVGINDARFRHPVVPGDTLRIESVVKKVRGSIWIMDCHATVDGQKVVEAEVMANMVKNAEGNSE